MVSSDSNNRETHKEEDKEWLALCIRHSDICLNMEGLANKPHSLEVLQDMNQLVTEELEIVTRALELVAGEGEEKEG